MIPILAIKLSHSEVKILHFFKMQLGHDKQSFLVWTYIQCQSIKEVNRKFENSRTFNVNLTKKRPKIQEGRNCLKLSFKICTCKIILYETPFLLQIQLYGKLKTSTSFHTRFFDSYSIYIHVYIYIYIYIFI